MCGKSVQNAQMTQDRVGGIAWKTVRYEGKNTGKTERFSGGFTGKTDFLAVATFRQTWYNAGKERGERMRDFPVFTTEYGVASLILKEVPYRQEAYIIIQSTEQPEELLKECVSFCRMVGAVKIYARGHEFVESYPVHCDILQMRGSVDVNEDNVENLWPVTEETIGSWRQYLNARLRSIDNAGTLEKNGENEILELGGAYFVHRDGKLLGAGWLVEEELKLIAAEPGSGHKVFHTLLSVTHPEQLELQVASTNLRAIRFYEKMGMIKTAALRRWYRIL